VPSDEDDALAESTATIVASGGASLTAIDDDTDASIAGSKTRKRWFRRSSTAASQKSAASGSVGSSLKSYPDEDDIHRPSFETFSREDSWGLGEDASMQMGWFLRCDNYTWGVRIAMYVIYISIGSISAGGVFAVDVTIVMGVVQFTGWTADQSKIRKHGQKHLIALVYLDGSGEDA
jgi:hypothetical protein